jgi:RNA polymerase subunit RPABC4/transcription elongation factor Spt4
MMERTCKNCQHGLSTQDNFCPACGAEVINGRLTVSNLWKKAISKIFGWENRMAYTLVKLLTHPGTVLREYIAGTRKKYADPFAFFALAATISLIGFVQLQSRTGNYGDLNLQSITKPTDSLQTHSQMDTTSLTSKEQETKMVQEYFERHMAQSIKAMTDYYTVMSFLFLPVYTLIAFWVYGKPFNFAEHLVINAFVQGIIFMVTLISSLLGAYVSLDLFFWSMYILTIGYYIYAYQGPRLSLLKVVDS